MARSEQTYRRNKNTIFQEVDGIIHILDEKEDAIVTLNETGTFLWKILENPMTKGLLVTAITDKYEVSGSEASRDVTEFIRKLEKLGFITSGS